MCRVEVAYSWVLRFSRRLEENSDTVCDFPEILAKLKNSKPHQIFAYWPSHVEKEINYWLYAGYVEKTSHLIFQLSSVLKYAFEADTTQVEHVKSEIVKYKKSKGFFATSLEWILGFQEVKAPGSSRLPALQRW
jgi:hypothetical protein